ncbi:HNH endonuclease signature motif containing protein [Streptomyces beigongshangae]|uniref:HNH endonuclease signature motif containing protein n=1 Tax=Streptomyces beigongshangae TaxID=2841597 RepID=UPI001C85603E|nr:HNH endonuclease signature motif containing protein [Streptomyces sp. REN17]
MPVSPYTRERLEEAASSSRTLSEALGKLGVDPRSSRRDYIRGRLRKLAVDTSHFEPERARWTKEILEPVVASSRSVNEVVRRLGLDSVGGHHTNIARRIKAYGLDTTHFSPVVRTETMRDNQRRRTAGEILVEDTSAHARRTPGSRLKRALRELGIDERCGLCWIEALWLGEPLPLEVDHIDGNWRNNRIENLRFLCPNCHAITSTWCRGSRRRRSWSASSRGSRPHPVK